VRRYRSFKVLLTQNKEDRLVSPEQGILVARDLDRFKPDMIHVHTEFSLGIKGARYGQRNGIPWLATSHTYFEEYINYYFPWIPHRAGRWYARTRQTHFYNQSAGVVAPTSQMKEVLERYGVSVPIKIVPTGVDGERFPRRPDSGTVEGRREYAGLEREIAQHVPELEGKRRLLFVGRIAHEKNVDFLFDMHRKLRESVDDLVTILVGDGPDRSILQKKAREQGVEGEFLLLGYREPLVVSLLYRTADVFVFPSITETQGLVTIEAMLSGLPVVAIGRMGTREIMNGDNGGYMTDYDLKEFTDRVHTLLTDPDLWRQKSNDAFEYGQRWTVGHAVARLEAFYRECTSESGAALS
jgi:glycosyltransferase involved in cell wall biosynthesis